MIMKIKIMSRILTALRDLMKLKLSASVYFSTIKMIIDKLTFFDLLIEEYLFSLENNKSNIYEVESDDSTHKFGAFLDLLQRPTSLKALSLCFRFL
jgi:hypothetical protein